jgi:hypothetical protein
VILRIVRGRTRPAEGAVIAAALGHAAGDRSGAIMFHMGVRPAGDRLDVVTIECWPGVPPEVRANEGPVPTSESNGGGPSWAIDVIDRRHYEVDEPILRQGDGRPAALRIACGRFSRFGSDIALQELLRDRVPEIGDELTEAYVGRRIVGRAVEVIFVSAWRRPPVGRALEDILWPEIALGYDDFSVDVYSTLSPTAA